LAESEEENFKIITLKVLLVSAGVTLLGAIMAHELVKKGYSTAHSNTLVVSTFSVQVILDSEKALSVCSKDLTITETKIFLKC
jgi:hypothetical protein